MSFLRKIASGAIRDAAVGAFTGAVGSVAGPFAGIGMDILFELMSDSDSQAISSGGSRYGQIQRRKRFDIIEHLDLFPEEILVHIAKELSDNGKKWSIDERSKESVLLSINNNSDKDEIRSLLIKRIQEGVHLSLKESEGVSDEEASKLLNGLFYFYNGQSETAIIALSSVLETNPNVIIANLHRGLAYLQQEHHALALDDMNKVLNLDPNNPMAYMGRGAVYGDQGQFGLAVYYTDKAFDLDPNNPGILHNKELAYLAIEKLISQSKNGPPQSPGQLKPEELFNRGENKRVANDIDGALEDFNETISLNPAYANAYAARGYLKENKLDDIDGAINDYTIALTLNPYDAVTYCNRGNSLSNIGDISGAQKDYDKTIELAPSWARGYATRGYLLLYIMGKTEKALADFDEALRLDPRDAITLNNRGNAKVRLGDKEGADADFAKANSLNNMIT